MNVCSNSFLNNSYPVNSLLNKLSQRSIDQKVVLVALLVILACVALYRVVFKRCVKGEKKESAGITLSTHVLQGASGTKKGEVQKTFPEKVRRTAKGKLEQEKTYRVLQGAAGHTKDKQIPKKLPEKTKLKKERAPQFQKVLQKWEEGNFRFELDFKGKEQLKREDFSLQREAQRDKLNVSPLKQENKKGNILPLEKSKEKVNFPSLKQPDEKTEGAAQPKLKGRQALEEYKTGTCTKIKKAIIFNALKFIKLPEKEDKTLNSVEGLMLYLSGLEKVNLTHPMCARVVVDVFKECDKEASSQLAEWLSQDETLNVDLLKSCLEVLLDKEKNQMPFSLHAIEVLVKTYEKKQWNQSGDSTDDSRLSSLHQCLACSMAILIKSLPNEDRIMNLAEWMMSQPEYDFQTFMTWLSIFQEKEEQNKGKHLYFPLLNSMMAHFNTQWLSQNVKQVTDERLKRYLESKIH